MLFCLISKKEMLGHRGWVLLVGDCRSCIVGHCGTLRHSHSSTQRCAWHLQLLGHYQKGLGSPRLTFRPWVRYINITQTKQNRDWCLLYLQGNVRENKKWEVTGWEKIQRAETTGGVGSISILYRIALCIHWDWEVQWFIPSLSVSYICPCTS